MGETNVFFRIRGFSRLILSSNAPLYNIFLLECVPVLLEWRGVDGLCLWLRERLDLCLDSVLWYLSSCLGNPASFQNGASLCVGRKPSPVLWRWLSSFPDRAPHVGRGLARGGMFMIAHDMSSLSHVSYSAEANKAYPTAKEAVAMALENQTNVATESEIAPHPNPFFNPNLTNWNWDDVIVIPSDDDDVDAKTKRRAGMKWFEIDIRYVRHPVCKSLSKGSHKWRKFFHKLGVSDFVKMLEVKKVVREVLGDRVLYVVPKVNNVEEQYLVAHCNKDSHIYTKEEVEKRWWIRPNRRHQAYVNKSPLTTAKMVVIPIRF
ncbi:hypothetical protein Tco_0712368 [Tanacetum coccineum]